MQKSISRLDLQPFPLTVIQKHAAAVHTATLAGMSLSYVRMHGAGNRILIVDARNNPIAPPDPARLRSLADEQTGPGFDQLMWLGRPLKPTSAASYRVFNSDGSEVEQCGNGLRCVASLLAEGAVNRRLRLDSPAGEVEAELLEDGRISVNMGAPKFAPAEVPFTARRISMSYSLDVHGDPYRIAIVSMGNPHCVLEVNDVADAPVTTLGPLIERHERFTEGVNVGFRHIVGPAEIDLRVFERGAGETLACGTGACAAMVTARAANLVAETVNVNLPGGRLMVSWRGPDDPVWLTGDAQLVDEGTLEL
jgi:diaminopimelate epimerase